MSRKQRSMPSTKPNQELEPVSVVCKKPKTSEKTLLGIVHQCHTVNIREEPDQDADIVCSIQCLTEVIVDDNSSTDEFYKIYTPSGIEGYCMKKYISVHP